MSTGSTIKKVQHSAQHIAFARHADDANCSSVNNVTMCNDVVRKTRLQSPSALSLWDTRLHDLLEAYEAVH